MGGVHKLLSHTVLEFAKKNILRQCAVAVDRWIHHSIYFGSFTLWSMCRKTSGLASGNVFNYFFLTKSGWKITSDAPTCLIRVVELKNVAIYNLVGVCDKYKTLCFVINTKPTRQTKCEFKAIADCHRVPKDLSFYFSAFYSGFVFPSKCLSGENKWNARAVKRKFSQLQYSPEASLEDLLAERHAQVHAETPTFFYRLSVMYSHMSRAIEGVMSEKLFCC